MRKNCFDMTVLSMLHYPEFANLLKQFSIKNFFAPLAPCVIFFCLTWTDSVLSTSPTLVCVPPVSPPKSSWEHNRARWENKPCSTLCYCFLWDNKALFLLFLSPCIITQNSLQGHEVIMTCERFDSRCTCIVGCFTPNPAATHMIFSASLRK